jgi:hypothetical protein
MTSIRARLCCWAGALLTFVVAAVPCLAQCQGWLPGNGYLGAENQVYKSVAWDPDGPGPQHELLVVSGDFTAVANEPYNFVAAFNGERFVPLGDNFFAGNVALLVYNDQLYAGGAWVDSMGEGHWGVFRFNTTTFVWDQIGAEFEFKVQGLTVYQGEIVASGEFLSVGDVPANRIAHWDGSSWQPFGAGLGGTGNLFSPVDAVTEVKEFQGSLYAAGHFYMTGENVVVGSIARWNGATWVAVGPGGLPAGYTVYGMDTDGQKLYIGGDFTSIGGQPVNYVASWDGASYAPLGAGANTWVYDLRVKGPGEVILNGLFSRVGGSQVVNRIAKWDAATSTWSGYGLGFTNDVLSTVEYQSQLCAFGRFQASGTQPLSYAARWTGSEWRPLIDRGMIGAGGSVVYALGTYQGAPIAAGVFRGLDGHEMASVGRQVNGVWETLNAPLSNSYSGSPDPAPAIYGVAELNGKLYIGGTWVKVGAATSFCVAQFDGTTWSPMGSGSNHNVLCVTAHNNAVYYGGLFWNMSGVPGTGCIARWNPAAGGGAGAWESVAGGVGGGVHAIVPYGNDLIVGGDFTSAGGVPANDIARWEAATNTWHTLGAGFNGSVKGIAVYNGQIYAGGKWNTASGSTPLRGVGRWNAATESWEQAGYMPGQFDNIEDLAVYNGRLYVCGSFETVAGITVNNIARFDGTTWESLGGLNNDAFIMKPIDGALWVGGTTFSRVGDDTVSPSIARWSDNAGVYVASQPVDAVTAPGGAAQLRVRSGGGDLTATFQWRRNGQPLSDGPTAAGSVLSGATGPTLTITGAHAADAGSYDCIITGPCNTVSSAGATLTVPVACAADIGQAGGTAGSDGLLNNNDFVVFIDYFFNHNPLADRGTVGGVPGHDGSFDNNDFVVFIDQFFASCG